MIMKKGGKVASGIFIKAGEVVLGEQLKMAFSFAKKVVKALKRGFIWIRPDGKQKPCRDVRSLVAAIMDYDGHLLARLVEQAQKLRGRPALAGV